MNTSTYTFTHQPAAPTCCTFAWRAADLSSDHSKVRMRNQQPWNHRVVLVTIPIVPTDVLESVCCADDAPCSQLGFQTPDPTSTAESREAHRHPWDLPFFLHLCQTWLVRLFSLSRRLRLSSVLLSLLLWLCPVVL